MGEKEPPVLFEVSGLPLFPAPTASKFPQTQPTDRPSTVPPSSLSLRPLRLPNRAQTLQRPLTNSHAESPC